MRHLMADNDAHDVHSFLVSLINSDRRNMFLLTLVLSSFDDFRKIYVILLS
jgi:hypothetical protein